jgi:hypothetical protein
MKLLQPSQIKDLKSQEVVKQILRAKEVENIVNNNNLKLAKSEMDFNTALVRYREVWEEEEKAHRQAVNAKEKEIEILEKKKQQALIPVQELIDKYTNQLKEIDTMRKELKQKEITIEETTELLQDKLDMVADKENVLIIKEKELQNKQHSIDIQNDMSKRGAELLTKQITDFNLKQSIAEQKLLDKGKELRLVEINLNAKADKNKRDVEVIEKERIRLNDMRITLERAMQRL